MIRLIAYSILLLAFLQTLSAYEIPSANFTVHRKGLTVSIPYEYGIETFVFTANINQQLEENQAASLFDYVLPPAENGHLVYRDNDCQLQLGDVLHYGIYIRKNGIKYGIYNLKYHVTKYEEASVPTDTTHYRIPDVGIKTYCKGFEITMPYQDGIQLFRFTANINSALQVNKTSGIKGCASQPNEKQQLIYRDVNSELQLGDVLHYGLYVRKNEVRYGICNLLYTVTKYEDVAGANETLPYGIPNPTFIVRRKGFEVTIPYEEGIECFDFTANINAEPNEKSIESSYGHVLPPAENGHLKYTDTNLELQLGDKLHYWLYVRKNGVKYAICNSVFTVTSYDEASSPNETEIYRIPEVSFKINRKGFLASIPYQDGLESFVFKANINSELQLNSAGSITGCVSQTEENKYLTYRNVESELKLEDVLHYAVYVIKHGKRYVKHGLVYLITNYEEPDSQAAVADTQHSELNLKQIL